MAEEGKLIAFFLVSSSVGRRTISTRRVQVLDHALAAAFCSFSLFSVSFDFLPP